MPSVDQRPQITGLALPAVRVNGGYFTPRRTYDVAWGDLIMAAFCPVGGRLMRRTFGSGVSALLMEPLDNFMKAELAARVRDAVERQCPHIRILQVDVRSGQSATGQALPKTVDLTISFTIVNDQSHVETRIAKLDRSSILQVVRAFRAAREG